MGETGGRVVKQGTRVEMHGIQERRGMMHCSVAVFHLYEPDAAKVTELMQRMGEEGTAQFVRELCERAYPGLVTKDANVVFDETKVEGVVRCHEHGQMLVSETPCEVFLKKNWEEWRTPEVAVYIATNASTRNMVRAAVMGVRKAKEGEKEPMLPRYFESRRELARMVGKLDMFNKGCLEDLTDEGLVQQVGKAIFFKV